MASTASGGASRSNSANSPCLVGRSSGAASITNPAPAVACSRSVVVRTRSGVSARHLGGDQPVPPQPLHRLPDQRRRPLQGGRMRVVQPHLRVRTRQHFANAVAHRPGADHRTLRQHAPTIAAQPVCGNARETGLDGSTLPGRRVTLCRVNGYDYIAQILKTEGVEWLACFPQHPIIEAVAAVGIRPIAFRHERGAVMAADGYSRTSDGRRFGVVAVQAQAGAENALGGLAQAGADNIPILMLPAGNSLNTLTRPNFQAARTYQGVAKTVEAILRPDQVAPVMRRAFHALRSGAPGPAVVEMTGDVCAQEVPEAVQTYRPPRPARQSPAARRHRRRRRRAARRPQAADLGRRRGAGRRRQRGTGAARRTAGRAGVLHHARQVGAARDPSPGTRRRGRHHHAGRAPLAVRV